MKAQGFAVALQTLCFSANYPSTRLRLVPLPHALRGEDFYQGSSGAICTLSPSNSGPNLIWQESRLLSTR